MALQLKKTFQKIDTITTNEQIEATIEKKLEVKNKTMNNENIPVEKLNETNKDKVLEAVKVILSKDWCSKHGIKWIQNGFRLIIYQGKKANIYGIVEKRENKPYFIRMHNSALLREFKKHDETKEFFKDVL